MNVDISMIQFDERGLVPVVVQEENNQVLMLAYMNRESLEKTIETGFAWYYSRSRKKLWKKGEMSGNVQHVQELSYDCDGDTILLRVKQTGVSCHTGSYSCFSGRKLYCASENSIVPIEARDEMSLTEILSALDQMIRCRWLDPIEGSYTN